MVLRPTAPAHASHPRYASTAKNADMGTPRNRNVPNNRIFLGSTPIYIPSTNTNRLGCQGPSCARPFVTAAVAA